jgi:hypothetical protein
MPGVAVLVNDEPCPGSANESGRKNKVIENQMNVFFSKGVIHKASHTIWYRLNSHISILNLPKTFPGFPADPHPARQSLQAIWEALEPQFLPVS